MQSVPQHPLMQAPCSAQDLALAQDVERHPVTQSLEPPNPG